MHPLDEVQTGSIDPEQLYPVVSIENPDHLFAHHSSTVSPEHVLEGFLAWMVGLKVHQEDEVGVFHFSCQNIEAFQETPVDPYLYSPD